MRKPIYNTMPSRLGTQLEGISSYRIYREIVLYHEKKIIWAKGQIISKRFFLAEDSSKKQTKTRRILVKTNSFVRFSEESSA